MLLQLLRCEPNAAQQGHVSATLFGRRPRGTTESQFLPPLPAQPAGTWKEAAVRALLCHREEPICQQRRLLRGEGSSSSAPVVPAALVSTSQSGGCAAVLAPPSQPSQSAGAALLARSVQGSAPGWHTEARTRRGTKGGSAWWQGAGTAASARLRGCCSPASVNPVVPRIPPCCAPAHGSCHHLVGHHAVCRRGCADKLCRTGLPQLWCRQGLRVPAGISRGSQGFPPRRHAAPSAAQHGNNPPTTPRAPPALQPPGHPGCVLRTTTVFPTAGMPRARAEPRAEGREAARGKPGPSREQRGAELRAGSVSARTGRCGTVWAMELCSGCGSGVEGRALHSIW